MRQLSSVRYLIVAAALLGALFAPSSAPAVEYKLKGSVKGDANGTVSMKVVVKKGQPRRIRAFTYSKLDGFCDQDESVGYETPAGERSGVLGGSTRVEVAGLFMGVRYGPNPQRVGIFGRVKQKGKRVVGTIEVYFNRFCKAGGNFVAT